MPLILVTPLSALPNMLRTYQPSHLISLLSPDYLSYAPSDFPADRHLRLGLHDIPEPEDGKIVPDEVHVAALLGFARGWDGERPLIVHCWAGVSRSMASAFAILCDRSHRGDEHRIAREIRSRAPHAQPNRLMVRHADTLLKRNGAMIKAVEELGDAVAVEEGVPVEFVLKDLGL
jgi:predicted protein tyrosine phosphatase